MWRWIFMVLVVAGCAEPAMAQTDDQALALLGDVDMRLLVAITVLAGVLRQIPGVPIAVAVACPTVLGCLMGALGAWGGPAYDVALAALVTGAGATIVGRGIVAALDPRKPVG